jgi:NADH:ubiquinone oxidoreductase subunit E
MKMEAKMMSAEFKEWEQLPESDRFLINELNRIQRTYGYISHEQVSKLAEKAGVPESQLHGLISFFNSFRSYRVGRHKLSVCYGTACYARGASLINDRLTDELELKNNNDTSADGFATVERVYCVGACSQAPLVVVDGQINGKLKSYQIPYMLNKLRKHE